MNSDKKTVEIFSGQFYVSKERNIIISTLLGSCVAVCLFDKEAGVGGMNHFMLPEISAATANFKPVRRENYGLPLLEAMINRMCRYGARTEYMEAKIFGGGNVARFLNENIPRANIDFALNYLKKRGINLVSHDVGGTKSRRIFFDLKDYSVYVKSMSMEIKPETEPTTVG